MKHMYRTDQLFMTKISSEFKFCPGPARSILKIIFELCTDDPQWCQLYRFCNMYTVFTFCSHWNLEKLFRALEERSKCFPQKTFEKSCADSQCLLTTHVLHPKPRHRLSTCVFHVPRMKSPLSYGYKFAERTAMHFSTFHIISTAFLVWQWKPEWQEFIALFELHETKIINSNVTLAQRFFFSL